MGEQRREPANSGEDRSPPGRAKEIASGSFGRRSRFDLLREPQDRITKELVDAEVGLKANDIHWDNVDKTFISHCN